MSRVVPVKAELTSANRDTTPEQDGRFIEPPRAQMLHSAAEDEMCGPLASLQVLLVLFLFFQEMEHEESDRKPFKQTI